MGISSRLRASAPSAKHRRVVNNPLSGIHGTSFADAVAAAAAAVVVYLLLSPP